jgi:hypothetical protein
MLMMEVTIEVMLGEKLEDIIREKHGPMTRFKILRNYACDTGGGCDYCTFYVLQLEPADYTEY